MNRSIDPIVSTEWLEGELPKGVVVVIDIRRDEEYAAGHIPGAISVPFGPVSAWAESDDKLLIEMPAEADLFKVIGDCGITADSRVVVVGRMDPPPAPPYALADPVRVAATLIYAGVKNVAVLAGGHPKWADEGRKTTTEVPVVKPIAYSGRVDRDMIVSTEYVKDRIGKSVIIDCRDPDQYFGVSIDPFADMHGHIPSARSLPLIWAWEPDGTYKPVELLRDMAAGVAGEGKEREVLTYCGVGGYASAWWFLFTQLLGYSNVKIYDGSMEAWVEENPLTRYTWCS
jgi:thiosulfate/3-mercaptopyruvate sulfurtransferase